MFQQQCQFFFLWQRQFVCGTKITIYFSKIWRLSEAGVCWGPRSPLNDGLPDLFCRYLFNLCWTVTLAVKSATDFKIRGCCECGGEWELWLQLLRVHPILQQLARCGSSDVKIGRVWTPWFLFSSLLFHMLGTLLNTKLIMNSFKVKLCF